MHRRVVVRVLYAKLKEIYSKRRHFRPVHYFRVIRVFSLKVCENMFSMKINVTDFFTLLYFISLYLLIEAIV